MAVSTAYDFILTRNEILSAALRKVTKDRGPFDAEEMDNAAQALNLVVKALQSRNVALWTTEWVTKALTASSCILGSDGLAYTCRLSHTSSSDNKPVTGSDWSTYWEQTGTSATAWVTATGYTAAGDFSLETDVIGIQAAFIRTPGNLSDDKLSIVPWLDYFGTPNKFQEGDPQKIAFRRDIDGIAKAYLWPQPDDTTAVIHLETIRKLKDFTTDSDNPDFPQKWYEYLIYQTAYRLSPEYKISTQDKVQLKQDADECFLLARKNEFETVDDDFVRPI